MGLQPIPEHSCPSESKNHDGHESWDGVTNPVLRGSYKPRPAKVSPQF